MEASPLASSPPTSVYSDADLTTLLARRSETRCRRRAAVVVPFAGSARSHKKSNRKKAQSHDDDETREHVVLLLCKLTPTPVCRHKSLFSTFKLSIHLSISFSLYRQANLLFFWKLKFFVLFALN